MVWPIKHKGCNMRGTASVDFIPLRDVVGVTPKSGFVGELKLK